MATANPAAKSAWFDDVVRETRDDRARVRRLVRNGRWREAEPDSTRTTAFNTRHVAAPLPRGAESVRGETEDFQGTSYLTEGARVRRAIAFVEASDGRSSATGSGFMISPRLFITNCHVISHRAAALGAQITFDRETLAQGRPSAISTFVLDPQAFELYSTERELDYAVLAVGDRSVGSATMEDLGFCRLLNSPDRHVLGMSVNVIQHPRGMPKMIAIRNNTLTARTLRTLLYETDTDHGSSGAPVFNDAWELVALHHWGEPFLEPVDENGHQLSVNVNEGVRVSAIYRHLTEQRDTLPPEQRVILDEALSYAALAAIPPQVPTLTPPRPRAAGGERAIASPVRTRPMTSANDANDLRLTVGSWEITVRSASTPHSTAVIEAGPPLPDAPLPAVARTSSRTLSRGAEAVRVDDGYANRQGYDDTFIRGVRLPLPEPNVRLATHVAPLRAGESRAEDGELKYEHFSIKMHRSKHLAMFTATNVDGATYLHVNRTTGLVTDGGEGERWFKDPRISETFWTGQDFYSEWSTYFDRGHLTRRVDPTWGTKEEAERANADTYHFTNCSPQHFRFNQTARFWQGAEQYVIEHGLLATDQDKRLAVFQGPIWDDTIDQFAGELQIPSSFFKVIVWKGARLKAVGLVVDQSALLSEQRVNLGPPRTVPSVNVRQWRVRIADIERRTGLSFGEDVRAADTIAAPDQPLVGGERAILLTSLEDILL
jgi:endonuclease G